MSTTDQITIRGIGHWSVRGKLESTAWQWCIEIEGEIISDDEYQENMLVGKEGLEFMRHLMPILPVNAELFIIPPDHIPGGTATFSMKLSDTTNPDEAKAITRRYFPALMKRVLHM